MKRLAIASLFGLLLLPNAAHAFNPNYLISDFELTDPHALNKTQIQHFLNRGFLGSYITEDWEGDTKTATDIIIETATRIGVSPKFLLVLLQKEQSLIEDDNPTDRQLDWATGYAVCDDCSKDDPTIQRWKGFGKQVNSAALQYVDGYLKDIYSSGSTLGKYGPGIEIEIDGVVVTPANAATAAMYAYTPHIHGNENFVDIWNQWFETYHPTGTLVQVPGYPAVWLIEYGMKRPIYSWSALISRFNADLIVNISESQLDLYPAGRSIDFPNYSLLKDGSGNIYLLVDDALRHIDTMKTFSGVGFKIDEIVDITNADVGQFDIGRPITSASLFPQGNLLQLETNGAIFFIQDGYRHAVIDRAILLAEFPNRIPDPVLPSAIEQFPEGSPVLLSDGTLVRSIEQPAVYVISEGKKRPIPSGTVFEAYGWGWDDIIIIGSNALNIHPTGTAIEAPSFLE